MSKMPDIIFDNCVLSNFALSHSLRLLQKLYENHCYVTAFVMAENLKGINRGHQPLAGVREALSSGWLKETSFQNTQERSLFEALSVSLGIGESSCIAIAKERAMVFACDDRLARKEADLQGVKLTGTIGILIKAVNISALGAKDADDILQKMVEKGFYSPVDRLPE
jgi:predicted nucleic acid-binding protein